MRGADRSLHAAVKRIRVRNRVTLSLSKGDASGSPVAKTGITFAVVLAGQVSRTCFTMEKLFFAVTRIYRRRKSTTTARRRTLLSVLRRWTFQTTASFGPRRKASRMHLLALRHISVRIALFGALFFSLVLTRIPSNALATDLAAAPNGDIDSNLAHEVNAAGFRAWASLDDSPSTSDMTVSPLAIWYLDQFIDPSWRRADPKSAPALKSLIARAHLSGTISANSDKVNFTRSDAAAAARLWGASTKWTPAEDSDIRIDVSLGEKLAFRNQSQSPTAMPFFFGDGIRAVRLDSTDGLSEVFLFQGPVDRLSAFRATVTESSWKTMISEFRNTEVRFDDFTVSRASYMEVAAPSSSLFGANVEPATVIQHGLYGNQSLKLTNEGAELTAAAAVRGKVVPPPTMHQLSDGTVVNVYHAPDSTTYAPVAHLPQERYISLLQPMIYVVVDRPTGVVLLIGMHK